MKKSRAIFWSAYLGNLFEHYDAALFGLLSPFLAPLIFPSQDPLSALILTYAIIPLGMLARPIGALVFGYIGDHINRSEALFWTLFGMGLLSLFMASLPLDGKGGLLIPLLFALSRIVQNFLSSGEVMGGAIYLLEHLENQKKDLASSIYNTSTIGGILLASFGVTLLSATDLIDSQWRLLYLLGGITAFFGCWIRTSLPSSSKMQLTITPKAPILKTLWKHKNCILLLSLCSGLGYANYSVAILFANGLIPLVSSVNKTEIMEMNTALLILDFISMPLFGALAYRLGREKMMITAALTAAILAPPLFALLSGASYITVLCIRICFILTAVAFFAPFHAFAQTLLPREDRYLIISFSYAIGSQLLGGPTTSLSLWLFQQSEVIAAASTYFVVLALLSALCIKLTLKPSIQDPLSCPLSISKEA